MGLRPTHPRAERRLGAVHLHPARQEPRLRFAQHGAGQPGLVLPDPERRADGRHLPRDSRPRAGCRHVRVDDSAGVLLQLRVAERGRLLRQADVRGMERGAHYAGGAGAGHRCRDMVGPRHERLDGHLVRPARGTRAARPALLREQQRRPRALRQLLQGLGGKQGPALSPARHAARHRSARAGHRQVTPRGGHVARPEAGVHGATPGRGGRARGGAPIAGAMLVRRARLREGRLSVDRVPQGLRRAA